MKSGLLLFTACAVFFGSVAYRLISRCNQTDFTSNDVLLIVILVTVTVLCSILDGLLVSNLIKNMRLNKK